MWWSLGWVEFASSYMTPRLVSCDPFNGEPAIGSLSGAIQEELLYLSKNGHRFHRQGVIVGFSKKGSS